MRSSNRLEECRFDRSIFIPLFFAIFLKGVIGSTAEKILILFKGDKNGPGVRHSKEESPHRVRFLCLSMWALDLPRYGIPALICTLTLIVEATAPRCSSIRPRFGHKWCLDVYFCQNDNNKFPNTNMIYNQCNDRRWTKFIFSGRASFTESWTSSSGSTFPFWSFFFSTLSCAFTSPTPSSKTGNLRFFRSRSTPFGLKIFYGSLNIFP